MSSRVNMANEKVGLLTVIEFDHSSNASGAFWRCKCECGKEVVVSRKNLKRRKSDGIPLTQSCGCKRGQLQRKGAGGLLGMVWQSILSGARARSHVVAIDAAFAWELFTKQEGRCALTGTTLTLPENKREYLARAFNASLDRIDSTAGYTRDNVQWVDKHINMMKQGLSQADFINLCRLVCLHNKET